MDSTISRKYRFNPFHYLADRKLWLFSSIATSIFGIGVSVHAMALAAGYASSHGDRWFAVEPYLAYSFVTILSVLALAWPAWWALARAASFPTGVRIATGLAGKDKYWSECNDNTIERWATSNENLAVEEQIQSQYVARQIRNNIANVTRGLRSVVSKVRGRPVEERDLPPMEVVVVHGSGAPWCISRVMVSGWIPRIGYQIVIPTGCIKTEDTTSTRFLLGHELAHAVGEELVGVGSDAFLVLVSSSLRNFASAIAWLLAWASVIPVLLPALMARFSEGIGYESAAGLEISVTSTFSNPGYYHPLASAILFLVIASLRGLAPEGLRAAPSRGLWLGAAVVALVAGPTLIQPSELPSWAPISWGALALTLLISAALAAAGELIGRRLVELIADEFSVDMLFADNRNDRKGINEIRTRAARVLGELSRPDQVYTATWVAPTSALGATDNPDTPMPQRDGWPKALLRLDQSLQAFLRELIRTHPSPGWRKQIILTPDLVARQDLTLTLGVIGTALLVLPAIARNAAMPAGVSGNAPHVGELAVGVLALLYASLLLLVARRPTVSFGISPELSERREPRHLGEEIAYLLGVIAIPSLISGVLISAVGSSSPLVWDLVPPLGIAGWPIVISGLTLGVYLFLRYLFLSIWYYRGGLEGSRIALLEFINLGKALALWLLFMGITVVVAKGAGLMISASATDSAGSWLMLWIAERPAHAEWALAVTAGAAWFGIAWAIIIVHHPTLAREQHCPNGHPVTSSHVDVYQPLAHDEAENVRGLENPRNTEVAHTYGQDHTPRCEVVGCHRSPQDSGLLLPAGAIDDMRAPRGLIGRVLVATFVVAQIVVVMVGISVDLLRMDSFAACTTFGVLAPAENGGPLSGAAWCDQPMHTAEEEPGSPERGVALRPLVCVNEDDTRWRHALRLAQAVDAVLLKEPLKHTNETTASEFVTFETDLWDCQAWSVEARNRIALLEACAQEPPLSPPDCSALEKRPDDLELQCACLWATHDGPADTLEPTAEEPSIVYPDRLVRIRAASALYRSASFVLHGNGNATCRASTSGKAESDTWLALHTHLEDDIAPRVFAAIAQDRDPSWWLTGCNPDNEEGRNWPETIPDKCANWFLRANREHAAAAAKLNDVPGCDREAALRLTAQQCRGLGQDCTAVDAAVALAEKQCDEDLEAGTRACLTSANLERYGATADVAMAILRALVQAYQLDQRSGENDNAQLRALALVPIVSSAEQTREELQGLANYMNPDDMQCASESEDAKYRGRYDMALDTLQRISDAMVASRPSTNEEQWSVDWIGGMEDRENVEVRLFCDSWPGGTPLEDWMIKLACSGINEDGEIDDTAESLPSCRSANMGNITDQDSAFSEACGLMLSTAWDSVGGPGSGLEDACRNALALPEDCTETTETNRTEQRRIIRNLLFAEPFSPLPSPRIRPAAANEQNGTPEQNLIQVAKKQQDEEYQSAIEQRDIQVQALRMRGVCTHTSNLKTGLDERDRWLARAACDVYRAKVVNKIQPSPGRVLPDDAEVLPVSVGVLRDLGLLLIPSDNLRSALYTFLRGKSSALHVLQPPGLLTPPFYCLPDTVRRIWFSRFDTSADATLLLAIAPYRGSPFRQAAELSYCQHEYPSLSTAMDCHRRVRQIRVTMDATISQCSRLEPGPETNVQLCDLAGTLDRTIETMRKNYGDEGDGGPDPNGNPTPPPPEEGSGTVGNLPVLSSEGSKQVEEIPAAESQTDPGQHRLRDDIHMAFAIWERERWGLPEFLKRYYPGMSKGLTTDDEG